MILTPDDIRKIRPVAENLSDAKRLIMYIHEAETLRLIDAIGAHLYKWFDEYDFEGAEPFEYERRDGRVVSITREQYDIIMDGGYYESSDCCGGGRCEGMKPAVAYIAYGRFIVNQPVNITAFGTRYKDGEFSTRVEDGIMVRASNEARKTGEAYLEGVVKCLIAFGLIGECSEYKETPRTNIRIYRKKL